MELPFRAIYSAVYICLSIDSMKAKNADSYHGGLLAAY